MNPDIDWHRHRAASKRRVRVRFEAHLFVPGFLSVGNYNTTLSSDSLEPVPAVRIHFAPPSSLSPLQFRREMIAIRACASDFARFVAAEKRAELRVRPICG
jgi:hypothetical protein